MNDTPFVFIQSVSPVENQGAPDDEFVPVEGRDRKSIELERQIEARAAAKTASDYVHIVWAYGVIWSLFAVYGWFLWRRALRLRADVMALERRIARTGER